MQEHEVYYDSWKENRDLILEYNQADIDNISVSNILGIGIDNVTTTQAIAKVIRMIEEGGVHHIISLNPYKLVRYRANTDLNIIYNKSDLKFASGAGILKYARRLGCPLQERISLLSFIMELIRLSEIKEYTIFLVGGRPETAEKAFFNIQKSFPKIRIVGRHGGYFNPEREKSVVEAIRKSQAQILLVGLGFPKEDKWVAKFRNQFKNIVVINVGGSVDVISGEIKKAPAYFMENGLDWFYRIISRPWRIGRFLRIILFEVHVIFASLMRKYR